MKNLLAGFLLAAGLCAGSPAAEESIHTSAGSWWRGNLHTHSLWSDGDDYPESIVQWYKDHGYHFLALSDHNVLAEGQRWIEQTNNRGGGAAFARYLEKFGADWVETRNRDGKQMVRLKPLAEFRHLFEEARKFLLIPSEEITARHGSSPIHINATNLRDFVQPQGGNSVREVMQNNVDAVLDQRRRTGQAMFPHLNHPNFGWGVTAEDLMRVEGERFFEVYNGHPSVHNEGDATHASTETMWDIILTWRIAFLELEPIFGIAVDDSHNYHSFGPNRANSGRGWVMVRASHLTPENIVHAMESGDFYASSGVRLKGLERSPKHIAFEIDPEPGVTYTTQFIGTRRGFDPATRPVESPEGKPLPVTQRYSDDIGTVLAETQSLTPSYTLKGDELYVRARIVSSKQKENPYKEGEVEMAWVQPVVPAAPQGN